MKRSLNTEATSVDEEVENKTVKRVNAGHVLSNMWDFTEETFKNCTVGEALNLLKTKQYHVDACAYETLLNPQDTLPDRRFASLPRLQETVYE